MPDILLEVLSPNNKDHDLVLKKQLYERFKVSEYWFIDPANKSSTIYQLTDTGYQLASEDIGVIRSALLDTTIVF